MTSIVYDFPAIAAAMKPEDWWPKKDAVEDILAVVPAIVTDYQQMIADHVMSEKPEGGLGDGLSSGAKVGAVLRIRLPDDFRVTDTCSLVTK